MAMFYFVIQQTLYIAVPLLIVALGGLFSERSGIVNIALEGIMVFGSFFGILTLFLLEGQLEPQALYLLAMFVAMVMGCVLSAIHAFASINMKADQTISGTAINMFAPAFTIVLARFFHSVKEIPFKNKFLIREIPLLSDIPVIGDMFFKNTYVSTYIGIAIFVVAVFVIYRTKFGLRLRAAGENPNALDAAGVNVYRIRWTAVLISGALAGLGGFIISIPVGTAFSGTVNGYGFLALAILIFGQWKPLPVMLSSIFFAFALTISNVHSAIPFFQQFKIPEQFFKMVPYISTLVVLWFTSKKSAAPKALGDTYDQGKR